MADNEKGWTRQGDDLGQIQQGMSQQEMMLTPSA
jgi:hypothetical protein